MRNPDQILACPLNGHACINGVRDDFPDQPNQPGVKIVCRWWQHLFGKDPQKDELIDKWDCAIPWLPMTTIESSQMARQTAASVDKVANEIVAVKQGVNSLARAIDGAATQIRAGIEAGSVTVMLPPEKPALPKGKKP